jgi:aminoglycoside phosphotransferase (APT) family kinase protein
MQRIPGISLRDKLMADLAGTAEMVPKALGATQARIHALDVGNLITALERSGTPARNYTPFRNLDGLTLLSDASGNPVITALAMWLSNNRPADPEKLFLCHGDFHSGNILVEDGRVTGVIDWGNFAIGHAEYDVAVTRFILSIGPIEDSPVPREQIDELIRQIVLGYNAAYAEIRTLDESLIDYYTALRMSHAMGKVLMGADGANIPGMAHDGYIWGIPVIYNLMRRRLLEITGIECGPLPTS